MGRLRDNWPEDSHALSPELRRCKARELQREGGASSARHFVHLKNAPEKRARRIESKPSLEFRAALPCRHPLNVPRQLTDSKQADGEIER